MFCRQQVAQLRDALPGVFIIGPRNRVSFSYISQEAGDHPSVEAILSALHKVGRRKGGASRR